MATPTIRTITSYNTHQDHSIDFFGNELSVTVTSSPSIISRWINNVRYNNRRSYSSDPLVVGVGVQWTPAVYVDPPADILQLCVGKRCLIIQLSHCNRIPNDLRNFLTDPETIYVGIWNGSDARRLAQSRHRLEIGQLFDIRNYVGDSQGRSLRRCSFEVIVEECMGYYGVSLDPEISMSDWSVYKLFDEQILQASLDVYVCYVLGVWSRLWED